jgi:lysyl-tRNA synthetase class 2
MCYVDLIMNTDSRDVFIKRSRLVSALRRYLDQRDFIEVETPVLQPLYGGAFATPFTARYEALDRDFYLRISDELYLKRLIVGGLERVYEIGKDFRNEGMDRTHNPEFTMLECYQAYTDYMGMLELCEEMVSGALHEVTGSYVVPFEGTDLDFTPPWSRIRYTEALSSHLGFDVMDADETRLRETCAARNIPVAKGASWGKLLDELFGDTVEPTLVQPTFVMDYPRELSPLAKVHRDDDRLVERFEPYAASMEIGNAFSEQNDPLDQRAQFEYQAGLKDAGDEEAHVVDDDYLRALEYGMPPTGGLGVGVDRLAMILAGERNIRDVILFPHLRPESDDTRERDGESVDADASTPST